MHEFLFVGKIDLAYSLPANFDCTPDAWGRLAKDRPVLRVIHTVHQAMTHHRSYQIRYTGESRCHGKSGSRPSPGKCAEGTSICIN